MVGYRRRTEEYKLKYLRLRIVYSVGLYRIVSYVSIVNTVLHVFTE